MSGLLLHLLLVIGSAGSCSELCSRLCGTGSGGGEGEEDEEYQRLMEQEGASISTAVPRYGVGEAAEEEGARHGLEVL